MGGYPNQNSPTDTAEEAKIITFDLTNIFPSQENLRLRGVGLAFGSGEAGDAYGYTERLGTYRLRATIHTPKQPKPGEPGSYYERPPIVLGNVSLYAHAAPVAMASGPECRNLDPRGTWTIVLSRLAVYCDNSVEPIEHDPKRPDFWLIRDLKLHLSLVAKPTTNAAQYTPKGVTRR